MNDYIASKLLNAVFFIIKVKAFTNMVNVVRTCTSMITLVFIMFINVKLPIITGILTFMSMINCMLS